MLKKHRGLKSIRMKLWLAMLLMMGVMVGLVWVMQIGFLDAYYKNAKANDVKNIAVSIESYINQNDNLSSIDYIERLAFENKLCIDLLPVSGQISDEEQGDGAVAPAEIRVDSLGRDCPIHGWDASQDLLQRIISMFVLSGQKEMVNTISDKRFGGENNNMLLVRSVSIGEQKYVMFIASQLVPVTATKKILERQMRFITIVLVLVSVLLSFIFARRLTRYIGDLSRASRRFADGDFDTRVEVIGNDEISQLAADFNYMAEEVSKVDASRREMIASVSHDLRTPLTLIKGYAEMIKDITGDNRQKRDEQLDIIIDEADRLSMLVEDMLHLSKIQTEGAAGLNKYAFDLSEGIENIVKHFALAAEKDGYSINTELVAPAYVFADKARIEQVVYNLLNNAINHMGEDRQVGVKLERLDGKFKVSVWDNGIGIAPEHQPLIWERYYRVDNSGQRRPQGTGLGLSIVKYILKAHDAPFGVVSALGEGSTFWFELKEAAQDDANGDSASDNSRHD